jgi:hypothetical protein
MEERTYLSGTSLAGMSPTRSRVENDYYATPFEATEAILSREELYGSILEPAAGEVKMDKVAGSGNDEFYTPEYAIAPLYKYLPPPPVTIWCPFDTEDSLFVKLFRQRGYTVIATHIANGQDFFAIDPPKCDYIISNPPYSLKGEVFERLFQLNIPFAMLVGVVGLFESQKRFKMFREHDFEIMYLNRRVSYFKNYADQRPSLNPPFSSVYVCKGMLPKQIIFEEIQKTS